VRAAEREVLDATIDQVKWAAAVNEVCALSVGTCFKVYILVQCYIDVPPVGTSFNVPTVGTCFKVYSLLRCYIDVPQWGHLSMWPWGHVSRCTSW
jgi:hypothetical protein